jgi:hypothetical protein
MKGSEGYWRKERRTVLRRNNAKKESYNWL